MAAPRPLSGIVPTIASKAMKRRGLAFGPLLADWDSIMGASLARLAIPMKLSVAPGQRQDAVLHLRVTGAAAIEIQHAEPLILQRINAYFGYSAVARLRLVQGAPAIPSIAKPQRSVDAARFARLASTLGAVDDMELKERLAALASAMAADRPGP